MRTIRISAFRILCCLLVAAAVLPQPRPVQALQAASSPYILRIIASDCLYDPPSRQQSGFRVEGTKGIVTALHGVIDCKNIRALEDDSDAPYKDLAPSQVDVERDIVLLTSAALNSLPAEGLETGSVPTREVPGMYVIGYPGAKSHQQKIYSVFIQRNTLNRLIPDQFVPPMRSRSSPNPTIDVLELDASTTYGNSGSPLVNKNNEVIGMLDGGLNSSQIDNSHDTSWAIPLADVKWRSISSVKSSYDRLARQDPSSSLAFSSTFPDYETRDIEFNPIYRDTTAFRLSTIMRFYDASARTRKTLGQVQLESAFDPRSNRKLMNLSTDLPINGMNVLMGEGGISMDIYSVGSKHYATSSLIGDLCMPVEQTADIEALQDMITNLFTQRIEEDSPFQGVLLGEEEINGVRAKHYLINTPSSPETTAGTGVQLTQITGGEVWITVSGGHLTRGTIESRYKADTGYMGLASSGTVVGTVDFYDIGKNVTINLPASCGGLSQNNGGGQANRNAIQVSMKDVTLEHNVQRGEKTGMLLKLDFGIINALNRRGAAVATVYFADGTPLAGASPQYTDQSGTLSAWTEITPGWADTTYTDLEIFLPYSEFRLREGVHAMQVVASVYDYGSNTILAVASPIRFTFTVPAAQTPNRNNNNTPGDNSALRQQVTQFLQNAVQAEISSYYYVTDSYAANIFRGKPLEGIQSAVNYLNNNNLFRISQFDFNNSSIHDIRSITSTKLEVDTCEYWTDAFYNRLSGALVSSNPSKLLPQTITIEQVGSNWYITNVNHYETADFCE